MRTGKIAIVAGALVLTACSSSSSIYSLKVGDCLESSQFTTEYDKEATTTSCSALHDLEVYSSTLFTDEEYPEYPGRDPMSEAAQNYCFSQFEAFVGIPYEQSVLDINWMYPTRDSWENAGDREILCLILAPEPVDQSLEGSAQ